MRITCHHVQRLCGANEHRWSGRKHDRHKCVEPLRDRYRLIQVPGGIYMRDQSCARSPSWAQALPSVWSQCQWVLITYRSLAWLTCCRADPSFSRDTAIPVSTRSSPSWPESTPILPPDPSRTVIPPRTGLTLIAAEAASAFILSYGVGSADAAVVNTMLLAASNTSDDPYCRGNMIATFVTP